MPKRREFWRVVRGLRKRFPLAFPVRVRFRRLKDFHGNAELVGDDDDRRFLIQIDDAMTESMAIQILAHEFAHCLRWDFQHEFGDANWHGHDAAWGVHHAEVYRHIFDGE